MHIFIDFEASSLGKTGYPIEVGWAAEDGTSENHLIRPAPQWTDWDAESERIHGISRATLEAQGEPHDQVARRVLEALSGHALFASAPSWDGKWLSALFRAAGIPRHALRLKDSEIAQHETAARILTGLLPPAERMVRVSAIVARARAEGERRPVRHRAVADAEEELRRWREVKRLAEEEAAEL
ncbi:transcriptional regulator [Sphingomonas parva]|uniref:Transcriptional regulator n=1 Tax=Sphingomonas parva TaxID=2555898 RepID=A0A4Y8ZRH1_9SPHN|nr:transcriptional regulator [Sphingomonas parva]TFI57006.1 transcriptional regulator [Sphingomonas parva]